MRFAPPAWNNLPLLGRLLVTASTALVIAGAVLVLVSANREAEEIRSDLKATLAAELETLPAALAETVVVGDFATLQQTLDRYVARPLVAEATFRDATGTRLHSADPVRPALAPQWFIDQFGFRDQTGEAPLTVGGRDYGRIELRVTARSLAGRAWTHLRSHLAILGLAILLDFLGIWLVLRSGLSHLEKLVAGTQALTGGRLDTRIAPGGSPELRELIESFNRMAASVQEAQASRNASEARLQEKMAEQEAILENSSVGIALVRQQVPLWVNRRMGEIFGHAPDEMAGRSMAGLFADPADFEELRQHALAALTAGRRYATERQMLDREGRPLWIRLSGKAMPGGPDDGCIWIFEDIGEQKRTEAELKAARDAADVASRTKSVFLANMSHEIRTPMNGVIGMAQLLEGTELSAEQRAYAQTIRASAESLLGIINDILDFSKVEAGKLHLDQVNFAPAPLVEDIHNLFAPQAAAKDIVLSVETAGDLPETVVGDPGRLRQILTNLLSNALKFTDRGRVALEVSVPTAATPGTLEFRVSDSGMGMPPEVVAALFSPFYQADSSVTRRFGGTGLGLSICKRLAELMGGRIAVASAPASGSVFTVTIPFAVGAGAAVPRSSAAPASANLPATTRVLVVEDNATNRLVTVRMLEKLGIGAAVAVDGEEALEKLRAARFDLVLMDCQMPVLDGYAATKRVRAGDAGEDRRGVPIVAMTANAMAGDRERCLAAGMDDYIAKPLAFNALAETLTRWLPGTEQTSA